MFFIISKVFSFVLNPLIWFIGLLTWGLFTKNPRKKRSLLLLSIVFIYIFSNHFIIAEFYRKWEIKPLKPKDMALHYDVGIVLGGGMITYDGTLNRFTFRNNVDRIMQAVSLYKDNKIGKILISSGSGSLIFRDMKESVLLKDYLCRYLDIPAHDIFIDSISDNTYENALYSKKIIDTHFDNPTILLITSSVHMRRSVLCFNKQGLTVTPYATNLQVGGRRFHLDHILLPTLGSLSMWQALLHELIGISTYKIMGYI